MTSRISLIPGKTRGHRFRLRAIALALRGPRLHIFLLILLLTLPAAFAQENPFTKTTADGVFTAAQAERGREAYAANCSSCHAKDLAGQAGPPLKGELFMDNWREDRVQPLFTYMRTRMPQRAAGSLSEQTYLDILSFILSENMLPAGSKELAADAIGDIQLVGPEGPGAMPKFALVSVVGCLRKGEVEWRLEKVSIPTREHDDKPTPQQVKAAETRLLGSGSLRLVYVEDLRPGFIAERNVGKKLHAQGYLLNNDKGEGLSVNSLQAVGSCTD